MCALYTCDGERPDAVQGIGLSRLGCCYSRENREGVERCGEDGGRQVVEVLCSLSLRASTVSDHRKSRLRSRDERKACVTCAQSMAQGCRPSSTDSAIELHVRFEWSSVWYNYQRQTQSI